MKSNNRRTMRTIHRYLGFFLAGVMTVYALSGTTMIFRNTDFLKRARIEEIQLEPGLKSEDLGPQLRIRDFQPVSEDAGTIYFEGGFYNKNTGEAERTVMRLPLFLENMTRVHKATTDSPLFWLNIFFGSSLLFFVVSAFWMYAVRSATFKKGLYFTIGGIILTLIMLLV